MYRSLRNLHALLLRLDGKWQNALNLLLLATFLLALYDIGDWQNTAQLVVVVLAPFLLLVSLLLALLLKFQRRNQLSHEEVKSSFHAFKTREKFEQIFNECASVGSGSIAFKSPMHGFSFMRRAKEDDLHEITAINVAAFSNSPWSDAAEKKYDRNRAFWQKNRNVFWVMDQFDLVSGKIERSEGAARPFFFSCFLPLTETGFDRYFVDRIAGDNDFRPEWVAGPDEAAKCLLLFTFARDPAMVKAMSSCGNPDLLRFYLRCCAVHIDWLIRNQKWQESEVALYFQNSDKSFGKLAELAGMDLTKLQSADEENVYVTTGKCAS